MAAWLAPLETPGSCRRSPAGLFSGEYLSRLTMTSKRIAVIITAVEFIIGHFLSARLLTFSPQLTVTSTSRYVHDRVQFAGEEGEGFLLEIRN